MAKRKFKLGDLVSFQESKWLPATGIITGFAHYSPLARSHAAGRRVPCWNVFCNTGKMLIISEDNMKLEQNAEDDV